MVYHALQAADALEKEGISAGVWDMVSLRPLDTQAILAAADAPLVVTVEEHSVHGGLGAAAAEVLSQRKPVRMKILGLPDEDLLQRFLPGGIRALRADGRAESPVRF